MTAGSDEPRAYLSLRMADWSIRHFRPADTEHWLDLAEARIS